jgi:hypothetical protein
VSRGPARCGAPLPPSPPAGPRPRLCAALGLRVGCCLACCVQRFSEGDAQAGEKWTNKGQYRVGRGKSVDTTVEVEKAPADFPTRRRLRAEALLFRAQRLNVRLDEREIC